MIQSVTAASSGTACVRPVGSYDLSRFSVDPDREIERLNAQIDLFWKKEVALYQRLGLRDGMRILDCGCGPGYLLRKLREFFPTSACTGVEIDPCLAARAEAVAREAGGINILPQSIIAMDLADNSFDFVIVRLVLEHLPEPMPALKEVLRVLKPGGQAVFLDNDFDLHERTWPDSPALSELYDAYRRARQSQGGNPCIGRQLPSLVEEAGFVAVDLHLLAAHSQVVGDTAFLKAEGAGIAAQLVKTGYLAGEALDRMVAQWCNMLATKNHAIVRMLFAGSGRKPATFETSFEEETGNRKAKNNGSNTVTNATDTIEADSLKGIRQVIREALAKELGVPGETVATNVSLISLGVDSIAAMTLVSKLESRFSVTLNLTDVLCADSVDEVAGKVASVAFISQPEKN